MKHMDLAEPSVTEAMKHLNKYCDAPIENINQNDQTCQTLPDEDEEATLLSRSRMTRHNPSFNKDGQMTQRLSIRIAACESRTRPYSLHSFERWKSQEEDTEGHIGVVLSQKLSQ
jgi:hypothetical protein